MFDDLPTIVRWALYVIAAGLILTALMYVITFIGVLVGGIVVFVDGRGQAKRQRKYLAAKRQREQAAFEARRRERGF